VLDISKKTTSRLLVRDCVMRIERLGKKWALGHQTGLGSYRRAQRKRLRGEVCHREEGERLGVLRKYIPNTYFFRDIVLDKKEASFRMAGPCPIIFGGIFPCWGRNQHRKKESSDWRNVSKRGVFGIGG